MARAWLLLSLLIAFPAQAQQPPLLRLCTPHDQLEAKLAGQFQEAVVVGAITSTGHLLRFYLDPNDGGWTLTLQKNADMPECVHMSGDGGRRFKWELPSIKN